MDNVYPPPPPLSFHRVWGGERRIAERRHSKPVHDTVHMGPASACSLSQMTRFKADEYNIHR